MIRRTSRLDTTLEWEHVKRFRELFSEYKQIKRGEHATFRFVKDFWSARQIDKRLFHKVYGRWRNSQQDDETSILPQKRGPRYKSRRTDVNTEQKVTLYRSRGCNRYEIAELLRGEAGVKLSASGVYNVLCRQGTNRLKKQEKERKIIKKKMGELGHISTCTT